MVFVKLKLFFQSLEFQCKGCFILLEIKSILRNRDNEIRSTLFPSCNNERELFIKKKMTRSIKGKLNEISINNPTNKFKWIFNSNKHESIEDIWTF